MVDFRAEFEDVLASVPSEHFTEEAFMPASGPLSADLMFVGEAPGENEAREKRPFIGRAGSIFDDALAEADLDREDVYITAVVKCRPPDNRDPYRSEIDAWAPVLDAEIERVNPSVIVAMGRIALRRLTTTPETITSIRGQVLDYDPDTTLVPTFHPAAILYDRSKQEPLFRDFELAASLVR